MGRACILVKPLNLPCYYILMYVCVMVEHGYCAKFIVEEILEQFSIQKPSAF